MGKTTLALSVLHDPAVVGRFNTRYFVSCEAVTSLQTLLTEVADALHLSLSERNENLYENILTELRQHPRKILVIDNLETIWEPDTCRAEVEEFLGHLDAIDSLSIIITMRGIQRPDGMSWTRPSLPALEALNFESATCLLEEKSGTTADEYAMNLLRSIDGIPLAVSVLASLVRDGSETTQSLWHRWNNEKVLTSIIEIGGRSRLTNLNRSIHHSLSSPQIKGHDDIVEILAMFPTLPNGFSLSEDMLDDLQNNFPLNVYLRPAIKVLQRISIAYTDKSTDNPRLRLRLLSPVRYYCQTVLPSSKSLQDALVTFYADLLTRNPNPKVSSNHTTIPVELPNIHVILTHAYQNSKVEPFLITASVNYTAWSGYIGNPSEDIITCSHQEDGQHLNGHNSPD